MREIQVISDSDRHVDFGIITIRDDEFKAIQLLVRNIDLRRAAKSPSHIPNRAIYTIGVIGDEDAPIRIGLVQVGGKGGRIAASHYARDLIEDLQPKLLLVVGICGLLPDHEVTLGDVVLASRVYDFSIGAFVHVNGGSARHSTDTGGPVHPALRPFLDNLRSFEDAIHKASTKVGDAPHIQMNDQNFVANSSREIVKSVLQRNFAAHDSSREKRGKDKKFYKNRGYKIVASPVNSGDNLIKTPDATFWENHARDALVVEMELGGVYYTAFRSEVPMLGVRAVSDVIGFKRDQAWTDYACRVAAAVAQGLMITLKNQLPDLLNSAYTDYGALSRERFYSFADRYCQAINTKMFTQYQVWGSTLSGRTRKVVNTAEACIFCARDWDNLTMTQRERVVSEVEWLLELSTRNGLPSLTYPPPFQNTVTATALGLQALAELRKYMPIDLQQGIVNAISLLCCALNDAYNSSRHGWRTVLCDIDKQHTDIRYNPTLMVVRAMRIADICEDLRNEILSNAVGHVQETKGIGLDRKSTRTSYAATLFLATEAALAGVNSSKLNECADQALDIIVAGSLHAWAETEELSIADYTSNGIERVPFTHWALCYALDYTVVMMDKSSRARSEQYKRILLRLSHRLEAISGDEPLLLSSKVLGLSFGDQLFYPLFLVGASIRNAQCAMHLLDNKG